MKKFYIVFIYLIIFSISDVCFGENNKVKIKCYDTCKEVPCPSPLINENFYGYGKKYDDLLKNLEKRKIKGDWVVIDKESHLMWQQSTADIDENGKICASDKITWKKAVSYCQKLNLAGFSDWRLPSFFELLSIIALDKKNPVIDLCCFRCRICSYWTSTEVKDSPDYVWEIYFYNGNAYWADKNSSRYVLCVRSLEGLQ